MAMVRSCGPVNTVITTSPAVNFVPVAIGENNSVTIDTVFSSHHHGVHRPTGRYFFFWGSRFLKEYFTYLGLLRLLLTAGGGLDGQIFVYSGSVFCSVFSGYRGQVVVQEVLV